MPLEVSEIGISMCVSSGGGAEGGDRAPARQESDEDREELIEECVRRVLQVLKTERER